MPQLELDKSSVRIVTASRRYSDEKAEELHARREGPYSKETSDRSCTCIGLV